MGKGEGGKVTGEGVYIWCWLVWCCGLDCVDSVVVSLTAVDSFSSLFGLCCVSPSLTGAFASIFSGPVLLPLFLVPVLCLCPVGTLPLAL